MIKKVLFYGYFGAYVPYHHYFFKEPSFVNRLRERGYDWIVCENPSIESRILDHVDWVIFNEVGSTGQRLGFKSVTKGVIRKLLRRPGIAEKLYLYSEMKKRGLLGRAVLMVHECIANIPENYHPKVAELCDIILTNHDDYVDNEQFFLWRLPTMNEWPEVDKLPFDQRRLLVCTLTNNYTSNRYHLGELRRQDVGYFSERWPDQFDLFGNGWNRPGTLLQGVFPSLIPKYATYRGVLEERAKAATVSRYRFNLCYENCATQPGWISPRLFDCMRSKCVPVFIGGTNVADVVDPAAFIDRRQFKDAKSLGDYLESITEAEFDCYLEAGERFISSERFKPFLITNLADTIASVLDLKSKRA